MKYSVNINKYVNADTYDKVMEYFAKRILKSNDVNVAFILFNNLGDYLDETKFPCDKMILNPFTGEHNKFGIKFEYDGKRIGYCTFKTGNYDIITIDYFTYENNTIKDMYHSILENYFNDRNKRLFEYWLSKYNANDTDDIETMIEYFNDYKNTGRKTIIKGRLEEIFDKYTTLNDKLKYCNGSWYKFTNDRMSELYHIFLTFYKGNYFLDNAVKRGVTID